MTVDPAAYRAYARSLAKDLCSRYPFVDWREIDADAERGLVEAARRFDESFNVLFTTFAFPRIRGAILDGIRERIRQRREEEPLEELAEEPADRRPDPEQALIEAERSTCLHRAIAALSAKQQHMVRACWLADRTLEDAGKDLGLTKSGACRSLQRAEQHLAVSLEGLR